MSNFDYLLHGFGIALSGYHVLLMLAGVLLGILVGVLPGLGAPNGVTLLLPLTFTMEPISAIILLTSMYWGALFGGSTTSILFNIPGEPSSVATTFDGYPMAKQGKAAQALTFAFCSAGIGALAGVILITLVSGWVASFAMQFSPVEYFAVYLLAFASFVGLSGAAPAKTLLSIGIGLACATVGMDTISGAMRLTYGTDELVRGISFLVAVIGIFGIGELLLTMEEGLRFNGVASRLSVRAILSTVLQLPRYALVYVRSIVIGCWMGVTPGGPTAASFMSYGIAKRMSRRGSNFGKGEPEGVIAPETADHAAGSSAMLPMLALGIPGSATAAVMMGGLLIWGLTPGPTLFAEQPDFVWGLIASMYLGNVVAVFTALLTVPIFAAILRIPFAVIGPVIVIVCVTGAYTVASAPFDLWLLLIFSVVGYVFKKLDFPLAPLVLAMILGDKSEDAFRQSMLLSDGSLGVFWSNPLAGGIMTLAVIMLLLPVIGPLWRRLRSR
ncbi:tripartite tricarboxylate transporter permease [Kerstersia gyiorum]|jgi:TctA family transporter|uniref:TctA family transporter n=1 Tax=Kerstersia gyiorum TaxID=206506 RepID=A0A171KQL3_9BURK|nr:tripartite tricarboxylate transporter permease [Kerstersia gyiorum]AZV92359.1 tricarboxylate transporter [Bordetella sp. J329]MCO7636861.1 tripartite tricarboxylate transporter permease [Pseudomonas sp. S 311-6]KAB0543994.1 tripartite tricarboxylate transporter permease [Kerstersia gyiorum]KKO71180.1 tricarboxylate transporter [Kerstersia gyiorum]MCH4270295.1 tripartite tricarboxylate transporter permease [Kerstersia gyiorum]